MRAALLSLLLLGACATSPASTPNLAGTSWTLVSLSATNSSNAARRPSIQFETSRAHGSAGCNAWAADFTQSGADLSFGGALMTRMACQTGMDVEHAFGAALQHTRHVEVSGTTLILRSDNNGELARFSRAADTPPQGS